MAESLEEFKDSFSYGSRGDLSFKFLKKLSADEAGEAMRQIFEAIGSSFDSGSVGDLHDLIVAWQTRAYTPAAGEVRRYHYDDTPWAQPSKPLAESGVGLLTSSGHFAAGDDPEPFGVKDMTQVEAVRRISEFLREPPQLSIIPSDITADALRVRHGGYDIRSTVLDHNVTLPLDALRAAESSGRIGAMAANVYSFPGATSQGRLRKTALPGWVEMIQRAGIDVMLLVPV